jgi:hypothetical protein
MMLRKRFFNIVGLGFIGMFVTKSFPFRLLFKNKMDDKKIRVIINPLAVKRQKMGSKNA